MNMPGAKIIQISDSHQRFLRDESSGEGFGESISFPESEGDVIRILKELRDRGASETITCQGACTGIRGLAVPHGGHIINCTEMNHILEMKAVSETEAYVLAEPGVTLETLNLAIAREFRNPAFFWPPSPTEFSATIGGIAATGACGMNVCRYGATADYIQEIAWVAPDGVRVTAEGSRIDEVLAKGGVITALRLRLVRRPEEIWGAGFFFENHADALRFADLLRSNAAAAGGKGFCDEQVQAKPETSAWIASMEYFDAEALALAAAQKTQSPGNLSIPDVPEGSEALIYLEIEGVTDAVEQMVFDLMEPAEAAGCDPDRALAFAGRSEAEKMHRFRHAVMVAVSEYIAKRHAEDTRITRKTIDLTCGEKLFSEQAECLREALKQHDLTAAVLAHIRDGAFEISILPQNFEAVLHSEALFT